MAAPTSNTMLNYFAKLPSKACSVEENPRKSAPIFNKQHVEDFQNKLDQFDAELCNESNANNYIATIRSGEHKPFQLKKKPRGSLRARLLQYTEDVRPPYFGTWQKESRLVTGRRPFGKDDEVFDYDLDSEAEWDIGGPGESLKGDDSDDEDEGVDDYEIDMKTFVPHGYVSDDEIDIHSDNEANRSIEEDCDGEENGNSNSSVKIIADIKAKHASEQQQQQQQTTMQQVKQTPKIDIKPITLGISYEDQPTISEVKQQFLKAFQGVSCG